MGNTELVTAVQETLNVNVIVIENGGYQAIRSLQVGKTGVAFGNELRARRCGRPAVRPLRRGRLRRERTQHGLRSAPRDA
jgi:3D-(3,5/4)-trihydroxycyclohexane-1,2-dione acylhydrolase (decyclizing)